MASTRGVDNLEDYAPYLFGVGDIAYELLGKDECVRRTRGLLSFDNAKLTEAACVFLKGQFREDPRFQVITRQCW